MNKKIKTAVVVFPGSNCDRDCARAWLAVTGEAADFVWHKEASLPDYDLIILPGGFSFGDYLRCGAVARFSPVMAEVRRLAGQGRRTLGICNGFQILTEAGLLPGALRRNRDLSFICRDVTLKVENNRTDFTGLYAAGQTVRYPIAHGEGGFSIDPQGLAALRDEDRIVFRYAGPDGQVVADGSPNGSLDEIAGIINKEGNVLGLMPHPERAAEKILGGEDGRLMFEALFQALGGRPS